MVTVFTQDYPLKLWTIGMLCISGLGCFKLGPPKGIDIVGVTVDWDVECEGRKLVHWNGEKLKYEGTLHIPARKKHYEDHYRKMVFLTMHPSFGFGYLTPSQAVFESPIKDVPIKGTPTKEPMFLVPFEKTNWIDFREPMTDETRKVWLCCVTNVKNN